MKKTKLWLTSAIVALVVAALPAMALQATTTPSATTGSIHGYVNDPTGATITNGTIGLSVNGGQTAKYTLHTDSNGNYTGSNIAPGTYTVTLREPTTPAGKVLDEFQNVKIVAGQDTTQNFDLSRPSYIKQLSPEQQKEIARIKKENASILKDNAVIKNLNNDLKQAREDNKNHNYAEAEALMTKAVALKPDAYLLWVELGIAQKGQKKYDDAISSLTKAISLDKASGKPNKQVDGIAEDALGEAYGETNKIAQAQATYDAAAADDPANASMFYQNEAIIMNRIGNNAATVAAADKAIAADPKAPIPYYLKGQALIQQATVDPKTQRIEAPAGCVEAYQKYLELAPNGPFAGQVQGILNSIGQKQHSSYRHR